MFQSILSAGITPFSFLICIAVSLVLGIGTALVCTFRNKCTQSFAITLSILPAVVQMVIMLVNGNLGAGVAVAGAFGLVRFRSAPGTAREIAAIFTAMAIGLASGMGYLLLAGIFWLAVSTITIVLLLARFGQKGAELRILRITIPENLDWEGLFDDLLKTYTTAYSLDKVKTSNMGTLFELQYRITLRSESIPKAFLDEIRCRNGNLHVSCSREIYEDSL